MDTSRGKLGEKHFQALKLLQSGLSRKEVAAKCGWSYDHFRDLCSGDSMKAGVAATLFSREIQKVDQIQDENIQALTKMNIYLVLVQMNRVLKELEAKRKLSLDDKRLIASYLNSLNKLKPQVTQNPTHSFDKGTTIEELMYEYTRLKAIAEDTFQRKKIDEGLIEG